MEQNNNISHIAGIIIQDWKKVNYAAKPYLQAMLSLNDKTDEYMCESAEYIVLRFLNNAKSYRGPIAKELKAKLREIIN